MKLTSILSTALLLVATACGINDDDATDYASMVNLMIGTGGHGHTHPAAMVPHGMIQPGPDTRIDGWDACSGYHYSDSTINGFSHTRLSGTGCADYGDVLLMPTVGRQDVKPLGERSQQTAYASTFSHENEVAEPGYYSVILDRYGVKAELTSTARAAIHRYTFPNADDAGFVLDLDYSIQYQTNEDMELQVLSDTEICGSKKTVYWAFDQYVYFYAKFSKPFTYKLETDSVARSEGGKLYPQAKALLQFHTAQDEQVMVKVGISAVDIEGARKNVESEIPQWDFDGVRAKARAEWNRYLSKIDIATADEDCRTIFYTALYHTALQPQLFSDADGRYRGMDLQVHQGKVEDPVYSAFSLWDTFRALHPLLTIIDPEQNDAYLRTLLLKAKEGGVLPMWELAGNYTGTMIGYHAASLFADAYTKGSRGFDVQEALLACRRAAEYDTAGIKCPALVLPHLMPQAKYWKNKVGYVPCDKDGEAVAKALEYAYDDWCIAQLANAVGDDSTRDRYRAYAAGYRVYFDPETRFMRGLDSEGNWREPFNPRASDHRNDDYCEGTAWQWTWMVPHDVDGLVELMGGTEAFACKLDSLFTASSQLEGNQVSADISGLIGQYAHGNEPSHHITHLYNYIGKPWRTQELVDEVLYNLYANAPDGLSGNEDCGQMSAWYILNAMGFYQVCPGRPVYSVGRPIVNKAVIHLTNGKRFEITVKNNSHENRYVRCVKLNGKELSEPFFVHDAIMKGGKLEIEMTAVPTAKK
ncbi:MAG: GH92 family glycosyl hydrolase [Muribaculaceae bacterium]